MKQGKVLEGMRTAIGRGKSERWGIRRVKDGRMDVGRPLFQL